MPSDDIRHYFSSPARGASNGPPASTTLRRRRIIIDDDDSDEEPTGHSSTNVALNVVAAPSTFSAAQVDARESGSSRIIVQSDGEDHMLFVSTPKPVTAASQVTPPTLRQRRSFRAGGKENVDPQAGDASVLHAPVSSRPQKRSREVHSRQSNSSSDLDAKHQYEGEAEEEDDDFISSSPDESDSEAGRQVRQSCIALRNRNKWQETVECPLCADLRVVLQHLLNK